MPIFSRLAVDKVSQKSTPHPQRKRETALREWNKIPATPGFVRPNASAGSRTVSSKYNTPKKDLLVCAEGLNGKDIQSKQAVTSGNRENPEQTPAVTIEDRIQRPPRARKSLPEPGTRGSTIKTPSGLLRSTRNSSSTLGSARNSSAVITEERALKQSPKASKLQTVFKRSFERRKSPDITKKRASTPSTPEDGDKAQVSILGTASYWLTQIKIAELEEKHNISMGFFRLAVDSSTEVHRELFIVLKSYLKRHPQNTCNSRETMLLYEGLTGKSSDSTGAVPADFDAETKIGPESSFNDDNKGTTTACHDGVIHGMPSGLDGQSTKNTPECNGDSSGSRLSSLPGMQADTAPHMENNDNHDNGGPCLDQIAAEVSSASTMTYDVPSLGLLAPDQDVSLSDMHPDGSQAIQENKESTEKDLDLLAGVQIPDTKAEESSERGNITENPSLKAVSHIQAYVCSTTEVAPVVLKPSVVKASGAKKSKKSGTPMGTHSFQPLPLKVKGPRKIVRTGVTVTDERPDGTACVEAKLLSADINLDNWNSMATTSMAMTGIEGTDITKTVYDAKQQQGYKQAYCQGFVTLRDNPEAGISDDEYLDSSPLQSLQEPIQQKDIRESTIWPELSAREGDVDRDKSQVSINENCAGIKQHSPLSSKEDELKGLMRYRNRSSLDLTNVGNASVVPQMAVSCGKEVKPRRGVHFNDVPIILQTPSPRAVHTRTSSRSVLKATPNPVSTLSRKGRGRRSKGTPYKEVVERVAQDLDGGILVQETQRSSDMQVSAGSEPGAQAYGEVCALPVSEEHEPEDVQTAHKTTTAPAAGRDHSTLTSQMSVDSNYEESTCLPPATSSSECSSLNPAFCKSLTRVQTVDTPTPSSGGQIESNKNVKAGQKQSSKLTVTSSDNAATRSGSIYTNSLGTPGSVRRSARLREAAESGNSHQSNAVANFGSTPRRSARTTTSHSMQLLSTPESARKEAA